jgi:PKD repeat protein
MRRFLVLLLLLMLCISPSLASENYTSVLESLDNATIAVAVPENVTPEAYRTIASGDIMVQCADPVILQVEEKPDGIHISDTMPVDAVLDIRVSYISVEPYIRDGILSMKHLDGAGIMDASWSQSVRNQGGYAYFDDLPFSEVIIGGFSGTYQKTSTVNVLDTQGLSNSFNASQISFLSGSITPLYTETSPYDIQTDGLKAWYRMDEGSYSTISDSSENGNTNTATNRIAWTTLKYGNALNFNGVNSSVTLPSAGLTINGDMTFVATFFTTDNTTKVEQSIFIQNAATNSRNYEFMFNKSTPCVTAGYGSGNTKLTFPNYSVQAGVPHFVAYSIDDTAVTIHINNGSGWYSETKQLTQAIKNTSATAMMIGGLGSATTAWSGNLDNLMLWNRSLTENEIHGLYYDKIEDMQLKTTSNDTMSSQIDGSGSVSIPYGFNDSAISAVVSFVPETLSIGGVETYNYSKTASQFSLATSIGYTENTTRIYESAGEGNYTLGIVYTPAANFSNCTLSYTSDDQDLLSAEWIGGDVLTDPTSLISYNTTSHAFTIPLDNVSAGIPYQYNVSLSWANIPQAFFSVDLATGWSPLVVNFTDESTGHPTSWFWDFGDGYNSTDQNPTHTYDAIGDYVATLTATTPAGNTSYSMHIVAVVSELQANDTVAIVAMQKDQLSAVEVHSSAITMIQTSEQSAFYDSSNDISRNVDSGMGFFGIALFLGFGALLMSALGYLRL